MLVSVLVLVAPGLSSPQKPEKPPHGTRQNLWLRSFFQREFISLNSRISQESFMESYVDRRIDRFLDDTRKGLAELESALTECRRIRADLLKESVGEVSKASVKVFRESFRVLRKRAGDLKKELSMVLPGSLRYKSDFKPAYHQDSWNRWLGRELEEISIRVALVGRHLANYLFDGEPVVAVDELGDRDILVLLFEIRKITRLGACLSIGADCVMGAVDQDTRRPTHSRYLSSSSVGNKVDCSCCSVWLNLAKSSQQETPPITRGNRGVVADLFVKSCRRWGPSPSVSFRELDSQDPCSQPHPITRTGS